VVGSPTLLWWEACSDQCGPRRAAHLCYGSP
jgi:hypothetical protein